MTLQEARRRLELAEGAALDRDSLKRAYLRAIKRHKPEVDPQGFQAVREAYELLQRMGNVDAFGAPAAPEAPAAPGAPADPAPQPVEVESPELDEPPAAHLAPYWQRLDELDEGATHLRTKLGWEAYRAFPGDRAARDFLLELLPPDLARKEIITVLLEGIEAGDERCLYRLLHFAPSAVPLPKLEELERDGDPHVRLACAWARLERRELEEVVGLVELALAGDETEPADPTVIAPVLRLMLALEERGDTGPAVQLRALLSRYLGGPGLPADVATDEAKALHAVAFQLEALADIPALRRELARGAIAGHFGGLGGTMAVLQRELGDKALRKRLKRLEAEAPTLAALIQPYVPAEERPGIKFGLGVLSRPIGVVVLLSVIRALTGAGDCARQSSRPKFDPKADPAIPTEAWAALKELVRKPCPQDDDAKVCESTRALLERFEGGWTCRAVANSFGDLRERATRAPTNARLNALEILLQNACPSVRIPRP